MVAERGEFKGRPTITLKEAEDSKFGFTFGLAKAKRILDHIDDIKAFVAEHEGADADE